MVSDTSTPRPRSTTADLLTRPPVARLPKGKWSLRDTRTYMSSGESKPNGDPQEAILWGGDNRR